MLLTIILEFFLFLSTFIPFGEFCLGMFHDFFLLVVSSGNFLFESHCVNLRELCLIGLELLLIFTKPFFLCLYAYMHSIVLKLSLLHTILILCWIVFFLCLYVYVDDSSTIFRRLYYFGNLRMEERFLELRNGSFEVRRAIF